MTTQQVIISASPEQVDILLAELGEIHFDIFEDSDSGVIAYCQTDLFNPDYCTTISFHQKPEEFKRLRIPSQTAMPANGSIFTKSISAGSLFTVGPFMSPNKDMAFWGEEIIMAARAYTHGYDLVIPDKQYLYHLYYNHDKPELNRRKIFWADFPNEFEIMNLDFVI